MLIESFAVKCRPNVDRENRRLNNVLIMGTEFNKNRNANFSIVNQKELVELGNRENVKVYCYLGHSRKGVTTHDRLIDRLGHYENFRIDGTKVRADLVLSPTIESNPEFMAKFPSGISEYIYSLAENEYDECGFSMCVGMMDGIESDVSIKLLKSVDLVENPALTDSAFSETDKYYEDPDPSLAVSFTQFNVLDNAVKQGLPISDLIENLINSLKSLVVPEVSEPSEGVEGVAEQVEETAPVEPSEALEETIEPEAPQVEPQELEAPEEVPSLEIVEPSEPVAVEPSEMEIVKADISELKEMIQSLLSGFSTKEEPKKEEIKRVVFSVTEPIRHEVIEFSKEDHREEYNRLRKENKVEESAKYFKKHLM